MTTDPVGLSNCWLWMDAADTSTITLSGQSVTEWRSKGNTTLRFLSGVPNQGTAASPQYVAGSKAVYFDNGDYQTGLLRPDASGLQSVSNVTLPATTTRSCYIVANILNGTTIGFNSVLTMASSNFNAIFHVTGTNINPTKYRILQDSVGGVAGSYPYPDVISPNATTLFTNVASYPGTHKIYKNGTQVASSNVGSRTPSATTISNMCIAAGVVSGSRTYTGYVHEILYYTDAHSDAQRQLVESYLSAKWQAPIPPLRTSFPLYQYVPMSPVTFAARGRGFVYLFVVPQDLLQGLTFNPLTSTISGTPIPLIEDVVTVYALDEVGVVSLPVTFTVRFPYVVNRSLLSAAAYTASLRNAAEINGAQNARDRRVLPTRGRGEFAASVAPDVVTQTVDPKCFSTSKCLQ